MSLLDGDFLVVAAERDRLNDQVLDMKASFVPLVCRLVDRNTIDVGLPLSYCDLTQVPLSSFVVGRQFSTSLSLHCNCV